MIIKKSIKKISCLFFDFFGVEITSLMDFSLESDVISWQRGVVTEESVHIGSFIVDKNFLDDGFEIFKLGGVGLFLGEYDINKGIDSSMIDHFGLLKDIF